MEKGNKQLPPHPTPDPHPHPPPPPPTIPHPHPHPHPDWVTGNILLWNLNENKKISLFHKTHLEISSTKCQPFCSCVKSMVFFSLLPIHTEAYMAYCYHIYDNSTFPTISITILPYSFYIHIQYTVYIFDRAGVNLLDTELFLTIWNGFLSIWNCFYENCTILKHPDLVCERYKDVFLLV